jgi:hypothetical protein
MSCNKVSFDTKEQAYERIKQIAAREHTGRREIKDKKPIRSYFCKICRKYHLTSMKLSSFKDRSVPLDSYNPAWSKFFKNAD